LTASAFSVIDACRNVAAGVILVPAIVLWYLPFLLLAGFFLALACCAATVADLAVQCLGRVRRF